VRGSPPAELAWREVQTILDEEVEALPAAYRAAFILCYLEGRSRSEIARALGLKEGTVASRLDRARKHLQERLTRRGISLATLLSFAALSQDALAARVTAHLESSTVDSAVQFAAGTTNALITARVAALANGALKALALAKVKLAASWLVAVVAAAALSVSLLPLPASVLGEPEAALQQPARPVGNTPAATNAPRAPMADENTANLVVLPEGANPGEPLPRGAARRFGSSRLRIGDAAFALSRGGRVVLTVSPEGILREFDAHNGRFLQRRQLSDRGDVISMGRCHARLSADGTIAAIDDWTIAGQRLTVWDVRSGKRIFRHAVAEGIDIGGFNLSPDGKRLAFTEGARGPDKSQALTVYDLETGREKKFGSLDASMISRCGIRFTADGKRVVVSQDAPQRTESATFRCFSVADGKLLWRLPRRGQEWAHDETEWAISPDGKTLVSAAVAGEPGFQIVDIDPSKARSSERFKPDKLAETNVAFAIAPDNRTVAMHRASGIVLWDIETGAERKRFPAGRSGIVWSAGAVVLSADGRRLVTNRTHLQSWDLGTGKPLFEAPPDDGLAGAIEHIAFTPDGKELFATGDYAARWDLATGKRLSATYAIEGQWLSTRAGLRVLKTHMTTRRDELKVMDPITWKPLHTVFWDRPQELEGHNPEAFALAGNGKTVLVAHNAGGKSYVTACDVASSKRLSRFSVPGTLWYSRPPFSPCGRWVVLGGKVYHIRTGRELFTPVGMADEQLLPARWSEKPAWFANDGRLLASVLSRKTDKEPSTVDTLAVWELASGKLLARFPRGELVGQVAFSPDGRTLALSNAQGLCIHDLLTGKLLAHYLVPNVTNHTTLIFPCLQSLVFSPDGQTLASGHRDGTVVLWKVPQPADGDAKAISESAREALWAELGSDSPAIARAAITRLARHPAIAVELLDSKFRIAPAPSETVAKLIKDLGSDVFARREAADRKLRAHGLTAEPALRRELTGTLPLETKRRIERILDEITQIVARVPLYGETLRGVRAIEVLERSGTAKARELLRAWGSQVSDARLAAEATDALERIGSANQSNPPAANR
jgi:WD40 repeat protein